MRTSPQQLSSYLWFTVDKLRGSISTHEAMEYLTGLVFLRLLSHRSERDASNPTDDSGDLRKKTNFYVPPEARWNVVKESSSPHGALVNAIEVIEANGHHLYSELLTFLPFRRLAGKPKLCGQLVDIVSAIDLEGVQEHELAGLVDSLLATFAHASGVQGGEFYTSADLSALLVETLNPEAGKSIYDPACGTGSLLLAAYQHALASGGGASEPHILGQEINHQTAAIARMNAALHGLPWTVIVTGDSLLQPQTDGGRLTRFDFILTNPPIGLKHESIALRELEQDRFGIFRYGRPTRVADFNFIQYALARLNDDGRAALLIGLRPLFVGGQEGEIRQRLVETDVIEAVVMLSDKLLPHTTASPALLLLNKNKPPERRNRILFVSAGNEYETVDRKQRSISSTNRQRIVDAVRTFQDTARFAAVVGVEDVAANEFLLLPEQYVKPDEAELFLGEDTQYIELGKIANVLAGTRIGTVPEGSTPIIQGRDLTSRSLSVDELEKKNLPRDLRNPVYSQAGDILVQRIGRKPQAYLVEEDLAGILIGSTAYVVRFLEDDRQRARYIVEFLNSDAGQAELTIKSIGGAVVKTQRVTRLRRVRVPIPNQSVIELINDLHQVEQSLVARVDKARHLRGQLFSIKDPGQFNEQLQALSVEAQVLSKSIVHADDLNFQVRNYYPYLLAYAYRALDAYDAQRDSAALYKEQLRVAENLLAFLGSIGLALAAASDALREGGNQSLTPDLLRDSWQGGISPGHWQSIGSKTAALLRGKEQFAASTSYANIWFKGRGSKQSEFGAWTQELVKLKNDFKHDRGPQTINEYAAAVQKLTELLYQCMREMAFFVQHPMRLIEDTDIDWKTGRNLVNTLVYVGDHPGLRQERIRLSRAVPKGKLYFELKDETLIPLYPLISVQYCEPCKMRESYMVDRWDGPSGRTVLKSFERGHIHDNDTEAKAIGADLEYWLQEVFSENTLSTIIS
jgi:type I restriction enzyme M protein